MFDRDLEDVIRTAQYYKVPYARYRFELDGPHEGKWRKIQEYDGRTLTQTDDMTPTSAQISPHFGPHTNNWTRK